MAADTARNRRTRWILVVASAIVGLAVAPLIALLAHGRSAPQTPPLTQGGASAGMATQSEILIPQAVIRDRDTFFDETHVSQTGRKLERA